MGRKVYFILSHFHVLGPDGSTNILSHRSRALEGAGYEVYWVVASPDLAFVPFLNYTPKFITWNDFLTNRPPMESSVFITSWDSCIESLVNFHIPESRSIFYLQSYHSHARELLERYSGTVITVSDYAKNELERRSRRKIDYVIKNGIDLEISSSYGADREWESNFICCPHPGRDLEVIRYILSRCDRITLLPKTNHDNFMQLIGKYRLLLNFHIEEGFGLPPLEGMSVGTLPVIVFSHGSTAYAKHMYNSFVFNGQVDSAIDFINNFESLISNGCYSEMVRNAMETVKNWDIIHSNKDFLELIDQRFFGGDASK